MWMQRSDRRKIIVSSKVVLSILKVLVRLMKEVRTLIYERWDGMNRSWLLPYLRVESITIHVKVLFFKIFLEYFNEKA